ncbi:MAG: hypothetical protein EA424_13040, partial [Planctomycetaceae bacterium]
MFREQDETFMRRAIRALQELGWTQIDISAAEVVRRTPDAFELLGHRASRRCRWRIGFGPEPQLKATIEP